MVDQRDMRVAIVLASVLVLSAEGAAADPSVGSASGSPMASSASSQGGDAPASPVRVRWAQTFGGGAEVDRGPTVEVYEDRTVIAHFPSYMKRAGTHTMRLAPSEWESLLAVVDRAQLEAFDAARVERLCEEDEIAQRARSLSEVPDLYAVHDGATTRLEVAVRESHAVRGRRAIGVPSRGRVRVAWYALAATAARHPEVQAVQGLADVERAMKALLDHPALARREERAR